MRALTREEFAVLVEKGDWDIRTEYGARIYSVCLSLTKRGCYVLTYEMGMACFSITHLGRLALRVSRPEVAHPLL